MANKTRIRAARETANATLRDAIAAIEADDAEAETPPE
jgi:hypothetical protein